MPQGVRNGKSRQHWHPHYSLITSRSQNRTWFDEHEWTLVLNKDYSTYFETGCKYPHYFDATWDIVDGIQPYRDK